MIAWMCIPEKDCFWWHWLTFWKPERKSDRWWLPLRLSKRQCHHSLSQDYTHPATRTITLYRLTKKVSFQIVAEFCPIFNLLGYLKSTWQSPEDDPKKFRRLKINVAEINTPKLTKTPGIHQHRTQKLQKLKTNKQTNKHNHSYPVFTRTRKETFVSSSCATEFLKLVIVSLMKTRLNKPSIFTSCHSSFWNYLLQL